MATTTNRLRTRFGCLAALAVLVAGCETSLAGTELNGITFDTEPGRYYVSVAKATSKLGWVVSVGEKDGMVRINGHAFSIDSFRLVAGRTSLVSLGALEKAGARVENDPGGGRVTVSDGFHRFTVVPGAKRVEINLAQQQLRAWQGDQLVLQTRISSGSDAKTPTGDFHAGPYKSRQHYSTLYNGASMPWSVQINGHVFVHGFASVPDYPASHGCIRLPLSEGNPAKFFYEWVDPGTPVKIVVE